MGSTLTVAQGGCLPNHRRSNGGGEEEKVGRSGEKVAEELDKGLLGICQIYIYIYFNFD